MLNDQRWLKLKSILSNFGIYPKNNLRLFIELEQDALGVIYQKFLVSQTRFLKSLSVGVKTVNS